jgi:hypothetical protein
MTVEELIAALDSADPADDVLFATLVRESLPTLGKSFEDLAESMTVSIPTVIRWCSGRTAPHPAMRPRVFKALRRWAMPSGGKE